MSLKLELFKTISISELRESGVFNDRDVEVCELMMRGYKCPEISQITHIHKPTLDKLLLDIRKKLGYPGGSNVDKSQNIININSAISLSTFIHEQNNHSIVNQLKEVFVLQFTDSQKIATKLMLNGYSKLEIAKIMAITSATNHLQRVLDSFGDELCDKNKKWLISCDFAHRAVVYLILLEMYAKNLLDNPAIEKNVLILCSL